MVAAAPDQQGSESSDGQESDAMSSSPSSSSTSSSTSSSSSSSASSASSVASDGGDDHHQAASPPPALRPVLSKSWAPRASHVPLYTGGAIAAAAAEAADTEAGAAAGTGAAAAATPLLVLPVDGDLAVVDATRGRRLALVRSRGGGNGGDGDEGADADEDEEADGGLDRRAITAFGVAPGGGGLTIFACTRHLMLREYRVRAAPAASDGADASGAEARTWSVTLAHEARVSHTLPVAHMALHPSGAFLATGGIDGAAVVWDARRRYATHRLRPVAVDGDHAEGAAAEAGARLGVTALRWLPSHRHLLLAVGRMDGSIVLYNLRSSGPHHVAAVLRDHVSTVACLDWAPAADAPGSNDGDDWWFVSGGRDAVLNLWRLHVRSAAPASVRSAGGGPSMSVARLHTLPVYERVEGLAMLRLPSRSRPAGNVGGGGSDWVVVTAGSKGRVRMWNLVIEPVTKGRSSSSSLQQPHLVLRTEQPETEAFGEARGGYMGLVLCPIDPAVDLSDQLVVADAENNLSFLSLCDESQQLKTQRTIVGHNDDILDLKVIPSVGRNKAERILVATNSSKVSIFDLKNFSCHVLDQHTSTVLCVDVSPCGRYVATCGKDRQMRVWDANNYGCLAVAVGHSEAVGAVAFSRKSTSFEVVGKAAMNGGGSFAITASVDRTIKRWNLPGSKMLKDLRTSGGPLELEAFHSARAHEKDINIVSVAPNDSLIATGSQDKTVKLWKASDLTLQATLKGHKRGVWDCQFSLTDRVLATSSGDRTIKLWSLTDKYSCVRTFQGHLASVLRVRFLRGGLQLVSSGADGLIKLWTIRTSQCEATMDGHSAKVWAMDLSPNGDALISGGADSKIVVWEDTTKVNEDAENLNKAEAIMLDQKLANHIRHKEYSNALVIALQRDKPLNVLKVITALIEDDIGKGDSGLNSMMREASLWSDGTILQVLRYCRDWNTRARNSHVATIVCKAILSVFTVDKLIGIHGLPEIMAGIIPYSERHFERIDRLYSSTFLLDFVLASMGSFEKASDVSENDFVEWASTSRLVLPPKIDGRTQVGGQLVNNSATVDWNNFKAAEGSDSDDQVTIGDSDSSDDE